MPKGLAGAELFDFSAGRARSVSLTASLRRSPLSIPHRPTIANTFDFRNRSTSSMKPIDGISSSSAVIDAIW